MFFPTLPPLLPFLLLLRLDGLGAINVQYRRKVTLGGVNFRQTERFNTLATFDRRKMIVVELLMVADYSLYDSFLTLSGGDTFSTEFAVKDYITAVFDQVRSLYRVVEVMGFGIELKMAGIYIALRPEDCPLYVNDTISNGTVTDAVQAVADIKTWISTYERWLPSHDHAAVITKLDMQRENDSSTQGMAYIGSICKLGDSASLTEDVGVWAWSMTVLAPTMTAKNPLITS
uniref:Uncharacterized protein n=1 Tax=Plectus sambesii TaxID=2011161 RepID=A0A914WVF7_9BILA